MNTTEILRIIDIKERRRFFSVIWGALLSGFIIGGIEYHDFSSLVLIGTVGAAFVAGTLLVQLQGTLTAMELTNEELILNYERILTNRRKAKKIALHTITDVTYSTFRTLVTIKSITETVHVTIKDSDKTPVESFVEAIKRKLIRRQL